MLFLTAFLAADLFVIVCILFVLCCRSCQACDQEWNKALDTFKADLRVDFGNLWKKNEEQDSTLLALFGHNDPYLEQYLKKGKQQ